MLLLATDIDWTPIIIGLISLGGAFFTLLTTAGGALWYGATKIVHWLADQMKPIFQKHELLADKMNTEMPKISEAMTKLADGQVLQNEMMSEQTKLSAEHGELLREHGTKITEIVRLISSKEQA